MNEDVKLLEKIEKFKEKKEYLDKFTESFIISYPSLQGKWEIKTKSNN